MASVFTKIVRGELPSFKIFEDDFTLSFLSIAPVGPGHTLVIPKEEIDSFVDVPPELYLRTMSHCRLIAPAIEKASGKKRVCLAVQGFEVPHFHVHLIPCDKPEDFDFSLAKSASFEEMEPMAHQIRAFLPTTPH
ncbi:MAG: HIT domain-containing protein [Bacteriovoracales bacterium]|nr:HIT domain-containing protein [Bacteriovoracales bacterium]